MVGAIALAAAGLAATAPAPHRLLLDPQSAAPYFDKGPLREPVEKFRQGQWRAAVDGLTAALAARRPPPRAEIPRARFLLGLAQANLGRWGEAAAIFEQLWQKDRLLRPYHAYQAAVCHLRRGDPARALTWADRVPAGSIPEAEAALIRIDALSAGKRWPEVEREGKRFAETFPGGPRSGEAAFATAVAIESQGRLFEAAERLRRIWADSRSETWSQRADARLAALTDRLEPAQRTAVARRPEDWLGRGLVLFDRHQNEAAVAALEEAVRGGLDPAGECRARYHLAQSVWKQRNRPRAEPLFAAAEVVCTRAGDRDLHARSMHQRGRCLAMMGRKKDAVATFAQLEQAHPDHRLADDARLRGADAAWELGDERTATDLASSLPDRYPYGDMVGDALWALAYRAYRAGQWDRARQLLARNRELVPRAPIWYAEGRAEYWEGRILEKQGRPGDAVGWYQKTVRRYPLAVYALLAFGRLEEIAPPAAASLQRELRRPLERPRRGPGGRGAAPTGEAGATLERAVELARMGLGSQSHRELARLFGARSDPGPDRDLTGTAALLLDRAGMWNTSHSLVDDKLGAFRLFYPSAGPVNAWELAYPRAWGHLVDQHSRANEVPPELQLALMREESAFNPRAESPANALGLTMVHPATARDLMAREVTREQLLDPQTNLALGARYLAGLLKRYRGVVPAIAAYNAGGSPVARWLRERGHLPVDEFLEEIPYEETRGYTKRVLASYFAYSWLYAARDRIPDVRLSDGRPSRRR
jgi:soluble lytic murein transglycosylase